MDKKQGNATQDGGKHLPQLRKTLCGPLLLGHGNLAAATQTDPTWKSKPKGKVQRSGNPPQAKATLEASTPGSQDGLRLTTGLRVSFKGDG